MTNMSCRRWSRWIAVLLTSLGLLETAACGGELTDSLLEVLRSGDPSEAYVVRSGLGHSIGDGVGYDDGFSSFSNFIPLIEEADRRLLFADVHLLMNNHAAFGGNIGVGHRIYDADANRTWGIFAWYDFRETRENWFHQMTIGFESLGEYLDIRSNVYIPDVADDRLPNPDANRFTGHQLVIADEAAMTGIDLEVGASLVTLGDIVTRGYGGGYFLRATGSPDTWGWRHRLELEWTDRLFVNLGVQQDDLFGRTVTVGITIHSLQAVPAPEPSPAWPPFRTMNRPAGSEVDRSEVASRLAEPTRRFRNIMIHRQQRVAEDPATGAMLSFLHVVPGGTGDGSIETPFGNFADAVADPLAAGSRIYTPQGGTFTETFSLAGASGTELLSSNRQRYVATQAGRRYLPGSGFTAETIITGDITVDDKTRLDGLTINGQVIVDGKENVTLHRNLINPLAGQAGISLININNAGDSIVISENTITGGDTGIAALGTTLDLDLLDNTVLDAAIRAIEVEATGTGTSTWVVTGNSLSGTAADDVTEALFTNSGTGTVDLTLTRNSSSNVVPTGQFNFDLLNTGGGGFTLQPFGSNSGNVGSSDSSVVIP